jgi:outer membrane protein assembly factor BamB
MGILVLATCVVFTVNTPCAEGSGWPTWRGPKMTGLAENADPPVTFGEEENLRWKVAVPGRGHSTPVIWDDRLFLLTAIPQDDEPAAEAGGGGPFGISTPEVPYSFDVICMDRHSGKTLWRKTARTETPHEGHHPDHGFASGSPVTDGRHVWAFFGSRGLYCFDMDGQLVWSRDLGRMRTRRSFGEGSSPTLTADAVIVLMDQEEDSFIIAVHKQTGKTLWKQARDELTSWTTPLVVTHGGRTEVVVNGTNRTRSYDPATGEVIWQCGGQTANVVPTPVVGFGLVYCTSGFRGNAVQAIELGRTGELTDTDAVRWQLTRNTPYVPSPLLYGDKLYLFTGNSARLTCLDARTGRAHYTNRQIEEMGGVYASPVGAAGRLYLAGRKGVVAVVRHSDTFEVLAVNRLDDRFDASPAIVGDRLYLRGTEYLYCIGKP